MQATSATLSGGKLNTGRSLFSCPPPFQPAILLHDLPSIGARAPMVCDGATRATQTSSALLGATDRLHIGSVGLAGSSASWPDVKSIARGSGRMGPHLAR